MLSHAEILELKRWNTPTVYNGWEQITGKNPGRDCFNLEETRDFMPQMGTMVGYAVTVKIEPGNPEHKKAGAGVWSEYRNYIASQPGPKIIVVQDLDKPFVFGSFWGEINGNIHRALGCVGCITDGAIRDLDEMTNAGFKAIARRLCVGHAFSTPVEWDCPVDVFGCTINPGQLIHADKHGFMVIPEEDEARLLDAVRFMDSNECKTLIGAARSSWASAPTDNLKSIDEAMVKFGENTFNRFKSTGEW